MTAREPTLVDDGLQSTTNIDTYNYFLQVKKGLDLSLSISLLGNVTGGITCNFYPEVYSVYLNNWASDELHSATYKLKPSINYPFKFSKDAVEGVQER